MIIVESHITGIKGVILKCLSEIDSVLYLVPLISLGAVFIISLVISIFIIDIELITGYIIIECIAGIGVIDIVILYVFIS